MPKRNDDLTVQAKDTYDERDYIAVHRKYFDGMRDAIKRAHGGACICIYCRHNDRAELETTAEPIFALRCANGHDHPKDTRERSCHCGLDICRVALNR